MSLSHAIFTTIWWGRDHHHPLYLLSPIYRYGKWASKETVYLAQSHTAGKWAWRNVSLELLTPESISFPWHFSAWLSTKVPFCFHSLRTLMFIRCSTCSLRTEESQGQCRTKVPGLNVNFFFSREDTLHLLSVLFRQRRKLARIPSPVRKKNNFSSFCGIRKQDGLMVSGCSEQNGDRLSNRTLWLWQIFNLAEA